jgi:DNA polymerase-3 subunit alpha
MIDPTDFVHLHVHTHYSLLDGLAKPEALIQKTKALGMKALAITDHGAMYGVPEFYKKCQAVNIKPIIGVELYIAPRRMEDKTPKVDTNPYHIVLLAKNNQGYKNLLKLVSEAHLKGYYYRPRVDKETLAKYAAGLIALSACLQGEIQQALLAGKKDKAIKAIQYYQETFGKDRFYAELQHHPNMPDQIKVNKELIKLSRKINLPLVVTEDVHYLDSSDQDAHEVLLCVQTGKFVTDKNRLSMADEDFSLKDPREFIDEYQDVPEAIENTKKIADACNLEIEFGQMIIPKFDTPNGITISDYFRDLCWQGVARRYLIDQRKYEAPLAKIKDQKLGNLLNKDKLSSIEIEQIKAQLSKNIIDRLEYEMGIIHDMGFESYFLIVQDFVNFAKNSEIVVGPGRGSAAGSIVSYSLNITDLDPFEHGLMFERFLNPGRISMPDIDIDFADDRRGEVVEYVVRKYGKDHVSQIVTFGTMKARNAVRDTGRALGMAYGDVDRVAKLIPMGNTLDEALNLSRDLREMYESDGQVKRLIDLAKKLEGCVRHVSVHAAGVVIGDKPLTEYLPIQYAPKGDIATVTQYSMYDIESLGLLKIDFLGLSNLTVIERALKIIKAVRKIDIDLQNLPIDDQKTYQLLQKAETTGIFQLESDGMKRYLKQLKPTEFADITAMVALYRPGPMELIPDYIAGKHGRKKITYLHPKLEPILAPTHGIAVYQEQVLRIARDIAGFTLGEADVLRKAIGKKIRELLLEQREKFILGAVKNGVKEEIAQRLFDFTEPFARYGFNKAHAACYAQIAYITAYLKAHFPAEFMAALLTSDQDNTDRITIEIEECRRLGLKVLPPAINESFGTFAVVPGTKYIRYGLAAIKNVGRGSIEAIVSERKKNGKFKSIEDFLKRVDYRQINRKILESLIKSGAFDEIGSRGSMLAGVDEMIKFAGDFQKSSASGQTDIFAMMATTQDNSAKLELPNVDEIDKKQKLAWERELLGVYISEHPLSQYFGFLKKFTRPLNSITASQEGKRVQVGGIITKLKTIITKNNKQMAFAEIEGEKGKIEILVFPNIFEKNSAIWAADSLVLITGSVSSKDDQLKILADKATSLEEAISQEKNNQIASESKQRSVQIKKKKITVKRLILQINKETKKEILDTIKRILSEFSGSSPVYIRIPHNGGMKEMITKSKVKIMPDLIKRLTKILSSESVEVR